MDEFAVILTPEAQNDVLALSDVIQKRILDKLEWIGANAQLIRHQALQGKQWEGLYRYRVGDYRLIYQLNVSKHQIVVLKIGHHRDIYKR